MRNIRSKSIAVLLVCALASCTDEVQPGDACKGISCSEHGTCRATGKNAACQCSAGYHASGLACLMDAAFVCGTSIPSEARKVADFLVGLTEDSGAMPDGPGGDWCNEDSNMEYALIGLAHAYACLGDIEYLQAFTRGTEWLAAREEMTDPEWRGSFRYAYAPVSPFDPVVVSPGNGITDARGVDATSGLFVYLLYLHQAITNTDTLVIEYADNARAALDFVLNKNWGNDGFSLSSWQLANGTWTRWDYEYTADQMDVYLGMVAGAALYDDASMRYKNAADFLRSQVPSTFYVGSAERYAIGRDLGGDLESDFDGFDGIFPQGYLPWILGPGTQNEAAYQWLASGVQNGDGSLSLYSGDPKYSLSAAMYVLAAVSLGKPTPASTINWLRTVAVDPATGGVYDTAEDNELISNVAGFTLMALLGTPPILP